MENLFDYATKELSQDAFLRWLFENYNCENESVKNACRKLFDSFTNNSDEFKDKTITELTTVAQWKNIDISIWFKIDGIEQLIVIEDKTGSGIHDDQLARYEKEIIDHNDFWRNEENRKKYDVERYIEKGGNVFKVFYKTNIIDEWEAMHAKDLGWKTYDIYSIYDIFKDINTDNEVLGYYIDYIKKIHSAARREQPPSEWGLISWHSFFNAYHPLVCVSEEKEINCYQKEYYYIKFFVKGHEKDLPCFEIRSRDFKFDKSSGKCSIVVRAVLYNLTEQANAQSIGAWQQSLNKHGFSLNHRTDITKHKQIGTIRFDNIEDNEEELKKTFDKINILLSSSF